MKKFLNLRFFSLVLICIFLIAADSWAQTQEHIFYHVKKVIDGDTIQLDNKEHVRLIGIDTPEARDNSKLYRDLQRRHLSKSAELAMGQKASDFTRHLVEGKSVRLEFDKDRYDDYHRLLAYVYLADGRLVNAEIVKAGYAYAYSIKPNLRYTRLFRQLYKEAKDNHKGLWQESKTYKKRLKWF